MSAVASNFDLEPLILRAVTWSNYVAKSNDPGLNYGDLVLEVWGGAPWCVAPFGEPVKAKIGGGVRAGLQKWVNRILPNYTTICSLGHRPNMGAPNILYFSICCLVSKADRALQMRLGSKMEAKFRNLWSCKIMGGCMGEICLSHLFVPHLWPNHWCRAYFDGAPIGRLEIRVCRVAEKETSKIYTKPSHHYWTA